MSSVVVTGATTPLGRALMTNLLAHDHAREVIAVVPPGDPSMLPSDPRLIRLEADLTRPRSVFDLLNGRSRRHEPSVIVHLAAHRSARQGGDKIHRLNVEATRQLLQLAERHKTVRRFVLRSHAEIYSVCAHSPTLIEEDQPLDLSASAPQWVRDRVESDLYACTRMGLTPHLEIVVLRLAECLVPDSGSQLFDYLSSRVCFRPLGFDPMLNLISLKDAARALELAIEDDAQGAFNIPGRDLLPLSLAIELAHAQQVPVPGPLLAPLYGLRAALRRTDFRYDLNARRFHFGGVLDGRRAREVLGYEPEVPIDWPSHGA